MKRRDLIKLLAVSGMSAGFFPLASRRGYADSPAGGPGKFFVTITANGGWDTTCLFDPKGQATGVNQVDLDNSLATPENIRWSAVNPTVTDADLIAEQYRRFFTSYSKRLTVIRGMDCLTTSHVLGSRSATSGMFGPYPSLGALFAAVWGRGLPLSYLTFGGPYGGNDYTAALNVTKAMLGDGSLLASMGEPNLGQIDEVYDQITQAHLERLAHQIEKENLAGGLPLRAQKMSELLAARLQDNAFKEVADKLAQLDDRNNFSADWHQDRATFLKLQARLTASSFAANISSSANLSTTGFDSHGRNDAPQFTLLGDLLEGIHYLNEALEYYDLADKTTILVVSDIGRTPFYNASGGKDHYPLGGQMIIHPKNSNFGGRTFGASTDDHRAEKIDFQTGLADTNGSHLNLRHMLLALREQLGIAGTEEVANFGFGDLEVPKVFS